jgi:ribose-phosphate pyrophosphokinase
MTRYTGVYTFPDSAEAAFRLAAAMDIPCHVAEVHRFPDGESLVRLPQPVERCIVLRSLDRPNHKLVELLLAASVLRRHGAAELCLVTPYLAYMRQDIVFQPGEPVSQAVIGALLANHFDRFVAVEPHLHRTHSLDGVFAGRPATALSAAPVIAAALRRERIDSRTVIIGPDEESTPLVEGVAAPLGLESMVGRKLRRGDRDVCVALPEGADLAGRPVVIVDDVISSGETILSAARAATERGARSCRTIGVHALFDEAAADRFRAAGIGAVESCDGVAHPSNSLPLAPLLASALAG